MAKNEVEELEEALAGFFSDLAAFQIEAGQISNAAAGVSALRIASSTAGGFLEPPTYNCEFIARGRSATLRRCPSLSWRRGKVDIMGMDGKDFHPTQGG